MKLNKYISMMGLGLALLASSCEQENPLEGEQYFKQVYIVGAYEVVSKFDVPYGDTPQSTYISVATGGSLNIDQDVDVTLTHHDATIDWYNNKYMLDAPVKYRKLEDAYCDFPSMTTTIKAGQVYSRLPFTIASSGLHCDSLYALTFKIESVSAYMKHPTDTVLVMNLNFVNDYSGNYQMTATKYTLDDQGDETLPTSMNLTRSLKAVSKDKVRFINESISEPATTLSRDAYFQAIYNNAVVFERQSDGTFIATGWADPDGVKHLPVSNSTVTYADGVFTFCYDYESGGKKYRLRGTMSR